MNELKNWYHTNFAMMERLFKSPIILGNNYRWVRIERFLLPPMFLPGSTKLLIVLPGLQGIENPASFNFYITRNLRRTDGVLMEHYFQDSFYNDLRNKGYARLSFHLKSWDPRLDVISGDNLVDICQALYNFLAQKKGV